MEYVITKLIDGQCQYLQELSGDDAYTDDLGHAKIFKSASEAANEITVGELYTPIYRDEDDCLTLDPQEVSA